MKTCTKCGIEKEESCFNFKNKTKGTLHSCCKECKRIIDNQLYKDNKNNRKEKIKNNHKELIQKLRLFVRNYKLENCCSNCGEDRWYTLDFHHLKDKDGNVSEIVRQGVSIKTLQAEIDKCILLCANCHREIHYQENKEVWDI